MTHVRDVQRPPEEPHPPLEDGYILIVEDDKDTCHLLSDLLEGAGYQARCCINGVEAFEVLHQDYVLSQVDQIKKILAEYVRGEGRPAPVPRLPALILIDLNLPVMNGWQLYQVLHSNPAFQGIPKVIMSADPRISRYRTDMLDITAIIPDPEHTLTKPLTQGAILTKVRELAGPPRPGEG